MTSFKLKFAVIAALGALASPTFAAWETLPVTGFPVAAAPAAGQPTGGTTPYRFCNNSGNFGSTNTNTTITTCQSPIAVANINASPEAGFTLVPFGSSSGSLIVNNTYTGNTPRTVGTYQLRMFRRAATNECIFATQAVLNGTDYYTNNAEAVADGLPNANGTQTFEINGVAMGGYASSGTVNVSYAYAGTNAETVYRIGRTFTSVQHRASTPVLGNTTAPGYYRLPLSSGTSFLASITGSETRNLTVPTLAQQSANLNANWVEFTTDANFLDPDGGSPKPATPAMYVKTTCSSDNTAPSTTPTPNATRFRLTWQEQNPTAYPQAFIELRVPGFVPKGANALPAPTAAPF